MTTHVVNTHEAKSRLSDLIRKAEAGDDVILARNGTAVAKIIPGRRPGRLDARARGPARVEYRADIVGPDDAVNVLFDESAAGPA